MSIGTSIFLSVVLLSVVLLFITTKDRWNWKKIFLFFSSGGIIARLLKYFGVLVVIVIFLCVIVFFYSIKEPSRFQCSGALTSKNNSKSATAYMQIQEYRWWVGLWSNEDGT